jgi:hypothetical protein
MATGVPGLLGVHAPRPVAVELRLALASATAQLRPMAVQPALEVPQNLRPAIHRPVLLIQVPKFCSKSRMLRMKNNDLNLTLMAQ